MKNPSTRAAISARFNSDNQREASIEDQIRLCRVRIDREGWSLAATYSDRAISGASLVRSGYQKLLQDVRAGTIDVVVTEALDRVSRDQKHIAGFFKQLTFAGVKIVTIAEGEISELHVGLKGTMNALFLKDLAAKTHRGLEGRIRQGRSAGGKVYGYDIVREVDSRGEPLRSGRRINEAEATIVRRIFVEFAAGRSPKKIAHGLNAEGIPGPAGRPWQEAVLRGHRLRRNGILRNDLYLGRLVWNRQRFVKDPTSGRRLPRLNPQSEWVMEEVPHLRIVDDTLANTVLARLDAIGQSPKVQKMLASRFWDKRRPSHLLTGLVRCGVCGGLMAATGGDYLACSAARKSGTCANSRGMPRKVLENVILDTLKHHLMAPDLVKEFISSFQQEISRQSRSSEVKLDQKRRELAETTRKLDGLIDAIAGGLRSAGLQEKL
jgi:DNA invertase Pin-like site-specific DNA recombinase